MHFALSSGLISTVFSNCGGFVDFCDLKSRIIDVKCDGPDHNRKASEKWPLKLCRV